MMKLWNRLFLEERPSISLSFFRMAVALTTGFHVLPTFCHLDDNYFSTALKSVNTNFFPIGMIQWVQQSPEPFIVAMVGVFIVSWLFFLIGFLSQLSCIVMVASCYYFYALNSFHIGTLSWDILLVTLFLMCVTSYHGDYFSLDCLIRKNTDVSKKLKPYFVQRLLARIFLFWSMGAKNYISVNSSPEKEQDAYKKSRPYFIQRLLQMQVGCTYFYTALYKVTAEGNWIKDNPLYYVMNYPFEGVTKIFLVRDFIFDKPQLCYWLGITIVVIEFSMVFLLFWRKTRIIGIYLGIFFHIALILTLDVPAIFFFLFPAQLLLFIDPRDIVAWIDQKRLFNQQRRGGADAPILLYDGNCGFCRASVRKIQILDLFATLSLVDLHQVGDLKAVHPQLTKELAMSQFHLIDPNGKIYGGFDVFRRICFTMPMLYILIPIIYFPGARTLGTILYKLIAQNRYLFHANKSCQNNACFFK